MCLGPVLLSFESSRRCVTLGERAAGIATGSNSSYAGAPVSVRRRKLRLMNECEPLRNVVSSVVLMVLGDARISDVSVMPDGNRNLVS